MIIDNEFKGLIPPLTDEEYKGLEESILKDGCRDALVLWGEILVDGHNRYEICTRHNIPFTTVKKDFENRDSVILWMIDTQFSRRNLSAPDRILLAQKKAPILERMARENQAAAGGDRKSDEYKKTAFVKMDKSDIEQIAKPQKNAFIHLDKTDISEPKTTAPEKPKAVEQPKPVIEKKPEPPKPIHTQKEVAKIAGVSSGTVARFEQVQKKKPEMIDSIRKGEMSINQAYQTVKKEERKQLIQKQVEEIEKGNIEKPDGLFDVIAIDPPWNYGTAFDSAGRRVANPYPEMTQQQLKELEIPAKENCVMFLWTTHKFIWDAKELLDTWGFAYRSMIVWDKERIGMGDLIRMQCEFCLIGIKGKPLFKDNHSVRDIIKEPRREHSRKPEAFYALVDDLCVGRKLDFFSREKREGWCCYGNDTEKF